MTPSEAMLHKMRQDARDIENAREQNKELFEGRGDLRDKEELKGLDEQRLKELSEEADEHERQALEMRGNRIQYVFRLKENEDAEALVAFLVASRIPFNVDYENEV